MKPVDKRQLKVYVPKDVIVKTKMTMLRRRGTSNMSELVTFLLIAWNNKGE